tara:strand:- start:5322 stop:6362 length:1041 start_codon:yes stop_codon:yes gene_type:complete
MSKKLSKKWKTGILFFLLIGFLVSMTFIRLPYFAFKPGSVNELSSRIVVSKGESFEPAGDIHFTTIKQDASINGWEFIEGTLKDSVHLINEDAILGTRNRDENQTFNFELMRVSKSIAVSVALSHLGLEPYTATGVGIAAVEGPSEGVLTTSDVIVAVNGKKVSTDKDLIVEIKKYKPGDLINLDLEEIDGSESREISIELGSRKDDPSMGFLGIAPQTRLEDNNDLPVQVLVNTGRIGGNSAGLALTLAVLDVLTPGELTGGLQVATTGTIDLEGNIGPVGGVEQKTITARDAGIDIFLVPDNSLEKALKHAGEMHIEGVSDLNDALLVLAEMGGNGDSLELPEY